VKLRYADPDVIVEAEPAGQGLVSIVITYRQRGGIGDALMGLGMKVEGLEALAEMLGRVAKVARELERKKAGGGS